MSILGVGISAYTASKETILNPNGFTGTDAKLEGGKVFVDIAAAATSFGKYARFSPVGIAYTAADLAVQNSPEYIIQYGDRAGENVQGWRKLWYADVDRHANAFENGTLRFNHSLSGF